MLGDAEAVKKFIPEWPNIDPTRPILIGLDSGSDHPFGAVLIVATPKGLVVVKEYLERRKAVSQHLPAIQMAFGTFRFSNIKWAANKNEANLRLEFGLRSVGVIPAENKHEIGIQRVQSWLHSDQLFFAYTCPKTIEQMQAYRYADNTKPSTGEKKKEDVFKLKDELPDALRYAIMAWPALPDIDRPELSPSQQKRMDAFDERTRMEIERVRQFNKAQDEQRNLSETDASYPLGDFFNAQQSPW